MQYYYSSFLERSHRSETPVILGPNTSNFNARRRSCLEGLEEVRLYSHQVDPLGFLKAVPCYYTVHICVSPSATALGQETIWIDGALAEDKNRTSDPESRG